MNESDELLLMTMLLCYTKFDDPLKRAKDTMIHELT